MIILQTNTAIAWKDENGNSAQLWWNKGEQQLTITLHGYTVYTTDAEEQRIIYNVFNNKGAGVLGYRMGNIYIWSYDMRVYIKTPHQSVTLAVWDKKSVLDWLFDKLPLTF